MRIPHRTFRTSPYLFSSPQTKRAHKLRGARRGRIPKRPTAVTRGSSWDAGTERHCRQGHVLTEPATERGHTPRHPPELCSAPPRTGALGPNNREPCAQATLSARGGRRWAHLAAGRGGAGGRRARQELSSVSTERLYHTHSGPRPEKPARPPPERGQHRPPPGLAPRRPLAALSAPLHQMRLRMTAEAECRAAE